jgi:predicted NUDIX family NTP pyrophosphohydrolase
MMTPKRSAGILLFRRRPAGLEVLLAHTGGPYFARRDIGAWSVPKGEYEPDETAWDAAHREFAEELGRPVPAGERLPLGEIVQKNGKIVTVWAIEADFDADDITPGTFLMAWPPKSGQMQEFPEIDRVQWFGLDQARERMIAGQQAFLDRLPT